MSKGFLWFAQNNDTTDYVELSIRLAKSIKKWNRENSVCVITDEKSKFEHEAVDVVQVLEEDDASEHKIKWANEHKACWWTPFEYTIKLEADVLWTANTDWWWYHLWQHDLVFSVDCRNYKDQVVKETPYRNLFKRNHLPNIYNGLMYFRKSERSKKFFELAEQITYKWNEVKEHMLINCHDTYPSTDVVFALAYRILDPTNQHLIDYEWFKFLHHKPGVNNLDWVKDQNNFLFPNKSGDAYYLGERRVSRPWHYFDKEINVRDF